MAWWEDYGATPDWLGAFRAEHGWFPWEDPGLTALGFSPEQQLAEHLNALGWSQAHAAYYGGPPTQNEWESQFWNRMARTKTLPEVDINNFLEAIGIGGTPLSAPKGTAREPPGKLPLSNTGVAMGTSLPYREPTGKRFWGEGEVPPWAQMPATVGSQAWFSDFSAAVGAMDTDALEEYLQQWMQYTGETDRKKARDDLFSRIGY